MSLAEIEEAVDRLSPEDLAKLAAHIARRDNLAWDKEIQEDFSPRGKHHEALKKIDAEIDAGISPLSRDVTRAAVFLEMLRTPPQAHSEIGR